MPKGIKTVFTQEEREWLKNNIKGQFQKDVAEQFNKKFNRNDMNARSISSYCTRYGLDNGLPKRYEKGNVPINKGTKGKFNVGGNSTSFKKGNLPWNTREVGDIRIDTYGYASIKLAHAKWKLLHRVIWERAYGKIPLGHKIVFIDGDKTNITLENLEIMAENEWVLVNDQLATNKKYNKTKLLVAKVSAKSKRILKEKKIQNNKINGEETK